MHLDLQLTCGRQEQGANRETQEGRRNSARLPGLRVQAQAKDRPRVRIPEGSELHQRDDARMLSGGATAAKLHRLRPLRSPVRRKFLLGNQLFTYF